MIMNEEKDMTSIRQDNLAGSSESYQQSAWRTRCSLATRPVNEPNDDHENEPK